MSKTALIRPSSNAASTPIGWRDRVYGEPSLAELLSDPVLHLLMRRDGVSEQTLLDLAETRTPKTLKTPRTPRTH